VVMQLSGCKCVNCEVLVCTVCLMEQLSHSLVVKVIGSRLAYPDSFAADDTRRGVWMKITRVLLERVHLLVAEWLGLNGVCCCCWLHCVR